jgi:hypothetical protein
MKGGCEKSNFNVMTCLSQAAVVIKVKVCYYNTQCVNVSLPNTFSNKGNHPSFLITSMNIHQAIKQKHYAIAQKVY